MAVFGACIEVLLLCLLWLAREKNGGMMRNERTNSWLTPDRDTGESVTAT